MINNTWILEFRTELLTTFFKLCPLLASDYFYITVIALGYWRRPLFITFKSLGFLVPFSTLLNCLLKNIFQVPRPDIHTHLIPVYDPFGFPSGDVQVALVFWGYIFIHFPRFRYLFCIPVLTIAVSRVYLGVHSLFDVAGALITGMLTLYVWYKYLERELLQNLANSGLAGKSYWITLLVMVSIYMLVSQGLQWPPMVSVSVGALIGFGLSLKWFKNQPNDNEIGFLRSIFFLGIVIAISLIFPVLKVSETALVLSLILKFSIIVICIFYLIPKTNFVFDTKIWGVKEKRGAEKKL